MVTMSRRDRKKQETRQRIRRAAEDLFVAQGYEETAMDQIAERADVSRATLFNYFSAKEGLLQAIALNEIDQLESRLSSDLAALEPLPRLTRIMQMLIQDTRPHLRLTRRVLVEALAHPGHFSAPLLRLESLLEMVVLEGQRGGALRPDLAANQIARLVVGAYLASVLRWGDEHGESDHADLDQLADMIYAGIAARRRGM